MLDVVAKDYAAWRMDKSSFIEQIKDSLVIERLKDIINATDYLHEKSIEDALDVDESDIFHMGFMYLSDQFSALETYFNLYLDANVHEFEKYAEIINLGLLIQDYSDELYQATNNGTYAKILGDLEEEVEDLIKNHDLNYEIINKFDMITQKIEKELGFEYVGILEVFTRVCEHFNLYQEIVK